MEKRGEKAKTIVLLNNSLTTVNYLFFHQFTAQTSVEMEHWISVICQAGKVPEIIEIIKPVVINKEPVRQLPSIPSDLMYDRPDSAVRPVSGINKHHQVYEMMQEPEEEMYHYIEHDTPTRDTKDKGPVVNEVSLKMLLKISV